MRSRADRAASLTEKFQSRRYRHGYVSAAARMLLAQQIRSMRAERGWSQGELAKRMGKPQSVVSRIENPSYGRLTVQTMLEVAEVFDVALFVRFMSFPKFIRASADLSDKAVSPESYV